MNYSVLDAAEAYVFERVKQIVSKEVTERLLEEFDELIQEQINKTFSEIIFQLYSEKDVINRADHVKVVMEWVKCKEGKKSYRTETVVVENSTS